MTFYVYSYLLNVSRDEQNLYITLLSITVRLSIYTVRHVLKNNTHYIIFLHIVFYIIIHYVHTHVSSIITKIFNSNVIFLLLRVQIIT